MLASDIKFTEIFTNDPDTGFPMLGTQRMMMCSLSSISQLMDQLLTLTDANQFSVFLSRVGYRIGMTAAIEISSQYDFDSPEEWLKAAKYLAKITGLSDSRIEIQTFNQEKKELQFSAVFKSSFELDCWKAMKNHFNDDTICHITTGALSGFSSVVFGSEVLVKEITCQSQGHKHCFAEGRAASGWGLTTSQVQNMWTKLELNPLEKEVEQLRKKLEKAYKNMSEQKERIDSLESDPKKRDGKDGIIYRSNNMAKLILLADKVAPTGSNVLIQGESGTGKELIAKYIHKHSNRALEPFRAINCAALPPALLESELFGHVKGAFTGADSNHKGLFLEVGKGSFFLDEIGELPLELQSKFLRVLQEREVRPVGGLSSIPMDARIIAATNRDLKTLVKENKFREDLYYRLAVFPLLIKPLRERKKDILLLARHFLEKQDKNHPGFSPTAIRIMESYSWPGNIRELENCIEYAVILAGNNRISLEHFPDSMVSEDSLALISEDMPSFKELEKRYTKLVLKNTKGHKSHAAKILGISVTTLWRRLKEMELS